MNRVKKTGTALMILALSCSSAWATSGSGLSNTFTINNLNNGVANLTGVVLQINSQGIPLGPLVGATVTADAAHTTTTNANGEFAFSPISPATYSVSVSKTGYHSLTRIVVLSSGQTKQETFSLTAQTGSGTPLAYDITSSNGKHLIEGMPGNLAYDCYRSWPYTESKEDSHEIYHSAGAATYNNNRVQGGLSISIPYGFNGSRVFRYSGSVYGSGNSTY